MSYGMPVFVFDSSRFGSDAHLERRRDMDLFIASLNLSVEKIQEATSKAFFTVCKVLYGRGMKPCVVGHEFFHLLVWQQTWIYLDLGTQETFPWVDEISNAFNNRTSMRSPEYAAYYRHVEDVAAENQLGYMIACLMRNMTATNSSGTPPTTDTKP